MVLTAVGLYRAKLRALRAFEQKGATSSWTPQGRYINEELCKREGWRILTSSIYIYDSVEIDQIIALKNNSSNRNAKKIKV